MATATLFLTGGRRRDLFVSTSPRIARAGSGPASRTPIREARDLGHRLAVLGSSPMGYGVYRRPGFEELFVTRVFELPRP